MPPRSAICAPSRRSEHGRAQRSFRSRPNRAERFGKALASFTWARRRGFDAKLCIHPQQVAPIHALLAPDEAAIAWARRVIAAEAESPRAAKLDGRMIDRPVVLQAQRTLRRADL